MKSYIQVKDVLESARRFHRDLETFYKQQAEEYGKSDRPALMLTQMARHERFFQKELEQYNDDELRHLLDRWIQYGPDDIQLKAPSFGYIEPHMQVEDVAKMALHFDEHLIDFYRTTAQRVEEESVRTLFKNLEERLEKNKAERANDAASLRFDM